MKVPRNSVQSLLIGGALVWAALTAVSYEELLRLGWIGILFLFAAWIVVPVGFTLVSRADSSARRDSLIWLVAQFVGAACATLSFLQPSGAKAGWLAVPWALNCAALSLDGLRRLQRYGLGRFSQICFASGEVYLTVGAAWFIASRLGMHPAGFEEPIVLLTAVHFHFAGFLSAVFAGLTDDRIQTPRGRKIVRTALVAVICGPGLLAAGFVVGPRLKLIAAMVMTVGECGLAVAMMAIAFRSRGATRWLLGACGACVIVAMGFAAAWAAGDFSLKSIVALDTMARVHGSLNAVGFGGLGILGWSLKSRLES